ncbi:MAG: hypothetical protein WCK64_10515 [Synechococcaceae cyanobacterium ELA445]|jgi:hypothetical protein
MLRIRLPAPQVQLELIATGRGNRQPFQVLGPTTEVAFVEELLEQQFGSLTINPSELFDFLSTDPWVKERFSQPQLVDGDLKQHLTQEVSFQRQTLGDKLVQAGILDIDELEKLLEDYRPFASTQRFGEFLKLNLQVPPALLELLLNPTLFDGGGFNDKRLGERLVELNVITADQLQGALDAQKQGGGMLGEVLAKQGLISDTMARFFSRAQINAQGHIEYTAT